MVLTRSVGPTMQSATSSNSSPTVRTNAAASKGGKHMSAAKKDFRTQRKRSIDNTNQSVPVNGGQEQSQGETDQTSPADQDFDHKLQSSIQGAMLKVLQEPGNENFLKSADTAIIVTKLADSIARQLKESMLFNYNAIHEYENKVEKIETDMKDFQRFENNKLDQLEQYQRLENIRIFGLEECDNEKTDTVVVNFVNEKLRLAEPITAFDIVISHRLGKNRVLGKPRPIIARFVRRTVRNNILASRKKLKGTKIGISVDLTQSRQQLLTYLQTEYKSRNCAWTDYSGQIWFKNPNMPDAVAIRMSPF